MKRGSAAEFGGLRLEGGDELVEGLHEAVHTLAFELIGDVVHVDASRGQRCPCGFGLVDIGVDATPHRAVIGECFERRLGQGVDRVGSDELVDVEHIGVRRILGTRRCPQRALDPGTAARECLPARPREHLGEHLVGELALGDSGVRGLTSNPSIFQKAIQGSADYDEQFNELIADNSGAAGEIVADYWSMVIQDIHGACDVFSKVYDQSNGVDGYVSVEVAPSLAHDGPGTESAARELHERIARRNLMVKIPGTAEGLAPIRQMIAEGRSINVTLIFSIPRYAEVM